MKGARQSSSDGPGVAHRAGASVEMLGLVLLLLSLAAEAGPDVTVYRLSGPVEFTDLYGSARTAEAAVGCPDGHAQLWLSPDVSLETLVHEMAHVYDCLDNGAMDASPTVRPAKRPDWASDYCWDSDAEWYACSVARYGSIHPHLHEGWGRPLPFVATP